MTTFRTKTAMGYATGAALALTLSLSAGRARADAVPPPPTDCAVGSQGESCHGGTYCVPPTSCTTSADCTSPEVCQATALCIGQVSCYGGFVTDGGPSTYTQQSVEGLCTGGTCSGDAGATCTTLSICVSPSSSSGSSGGPIAVQSGCSCEGVGGLRGSSAIAVLALGAAALGMASRRRRAPTVQRAARQRRE
jgi:hypothetical protein